MFNRTLYSLIGISCLALGNNLTYATEPTPPVRVTVRPLQEILTILCAIPSTYEQQREVFENKRIALKAFDTHLERKIDSFNRINVTFTLDRNRDLDAEEWWRSLIDFVRFCAMTIGQETWVQGLDTEISWSSNSASAVFTFGSPESPAQGSLELSLGASDCCKCCYPVCNCPDRGDGTCSCNDKEVTNCCNT